MPDSAGAERRRVILDYVRSVGQVEVTELAARCHVAAETVRRDLKVLDDHGLVSRTHGGAFPAQGARYETSLSVRARHRVPEKRRIAARRRQCSTMLETIYIDEGFTQELIAEELRGLDQQLTVVTASLGVARITAPAEQMSVIVLGGRVRERTMGTVDHWAIDMLSDMVIDLAIMGANGISLDRGLTTPDPALQAVKRGSVQVSRRRVFVGVSTKFGVRSFCRFAEVTDFEKLITDTDSPRTTRAGSAISVQSDPGLTQHLGCLAVCRRKAHPPRR